VPATQAPAQGEHKEEDNHEKKETKKNKEEKRTLRSQDDGPRLKSELAVYFPNYEDVMFDVRADEEDLLTVDSVLYIADDTAKKKDNELSPVKTGKATANGRRTSVNNTRSPATPHRAVPSLSNTSPVVNLDFLSKTTSEESAAAVDADVL
jgi:hypothetical protein